MSQREPLVEEPTIGKLVLDVSRDTSALIQKEIQLAKSELKVSVQAGGMGIAFFAVAAFLLLLAVIMLSCAFAWFLVMAGLHAAWAFLIVFGVYVLLAAIVGLIGYRKVTKVKAPERAISQAQQTAGMFSR